MTQTIERNGEAVCSSRFELSRQAALAELAGDSVLKGNIAEEDMRENFLQTPLRLNIGAGQIELPGFESIDRAKGKEAYPLDYPDESVDEILASHILEHFSHQDVQAVLTNWVAKLKPGGKIRLAVPNFKILVEQYLENAPVFIQGYIMGGHQDENDKHGAIFDPDSLTDLMSTCGLERIGPWVPDFASCASAPNSLNLQGFKPSGKQKDLSSVRAVLSTPRFGPLMHPKCAERAFLMLGIKAKSTQSCFWHQQISILMEEMLAEKGCEFVLTMDFDTIFSAEDVLELFRIMHAHPEIDALFPLQSKRGCEQALFSVCDSEGKFTPKIHLGDLSRNFLPAATGHFGLTMFRAESLRKFPRPWMVPQPANDGTWRGEGQVDADIDFWKRFRAAGFKCALAPKVVVGHLEEVVKWPGQDLKPIFQTTADYEEFGMPAEVCR